MNPPGRIALLCACAAMPCSAVHAQEFPLRPLRIVTSAVGGATDLVARLIARGLTASLGQQAIVDNRPAGNGIVGLQATAKANPDGYTLLFTGQGQVSLYPVLRANLPYDPPKDLAPIIRVGSLEKIGRAHV